MLSELRWLTGVVDSIRVLDREVLEPELVAAMDSFSETAAALRVRDAKYWSDPERARVGAKFGLQAAERLARSYGAVGLAHPARVDREDLARWSQPEAIIARYREDRGQLGLD